MKRLVLIGLAMITLLVAGCGEKSSSKHRIDNIRRVFLQNEWKYVFYMQEPGSEKVETETIESHRSHLNNTDPGKITVMTDAPKDKPIWLEYERVIMRDGHDFNRNVVLHIHELQEIEGAEERTGGKFPIHHRNSPVE